MKRLLLLLSVVALAGCSRYSDSQEAYLACLDLEIRNEVEMTRCERAISSKPHYKTQVKGRTYRFYY